MLSLRFVVMLPFILGLAATGANSAPVGPSFEEASEISRVGKEYAAEVRAAAAEAFDAEQEHIGPRAIDETIPTLLEALKDPTSAGAETALAALREVMRARADVVFPVLLPTLTAQPLTAFNANALAALVQVAGPALPKK
ncbi:unnamed protein product [Tilletia controversa]|nr:unnamed protein product [Tilletia controversa]